MKRIAICILACLFFVFGFTACGQTPEKDGEILFAMWGTDADVTRAEVIADKFQKIYNDYKVTVKRIDGNYEQNLLLAFNGDESDVPDVFFVKTGYVASWIREGLIANIQSEVEAGENFNENNLWSFNDGYRYNGKTMGSGDLYAIIKDFTPEWTVIYNKDFIDEY